MYKRILITTDGSDKSRMAAKDSIELAKALGAQVIALNVVNEVVITSAVRQLSFKMLKKSGHVDIITSEFVSSLTLPNFISKVILTELGRQSLKEKR
jgi:nucleotide-binding universal stress UspA family protein